MIEGRLFGSLEVTISGVAMNRLRSRKSYALLSLLILRADMEVLRDFICDTLWPDSTREKARLGLRQCLNDVRLALGAEAYRIGAPTTRSLQFDSTDCEIDVVRFDHLVKSSELTRDQIDEVLSLYRAPLLEQYAEDFIFYERELRLRQLLEILECECGKAFQRGALADSSRWAKFAVTLNPLSETACRSLMLTLAAERNVPEAVKVYTEFRQRLWQEMRLVPSLETVGVYRSIKSPRTETPSSKLRTVKPISRMIGRDSEFAHVNALLVDARIVTIVGAAGLGKTRLALEIANKGGHPFIQLAPLTVPELLADHVAREMQIHCPEDRDSIDILLDHLRTGQDTLVLDNAEHIIEACARLVHRFVAETDETKIIVTSRVALGIPGEHVLQLNPLELGQASPAATLFVERANMTSPRRLDPEADSTLITQICSRLEGIPLALELAAARLRTMSLVQVAEG